MKLLGILRLALRSLVRNPLRSVLMMLGVAIGIAALVAIASVGEATRQETMRQFSRMVGTFDNLTIQPGPATTRGMPAVNTVPPSLSFADAQAIASEIRGVRRVAEVQAAFDLDVRYRDVSVPTSIWGVAASWMDIRDFDIAFGAGISEEDVAAMARVAVIGEDLRRMLFGDEDPVGQLLRVADVPFQVQGVMASRGVGPGGSSLDNLMIIPVSTASRRLFNRDYLTSITVQLSNPQEMDRVIDDITGLLRERHGIFPPVEDDFVINNPRASMMRVAEVSSTLGTILSGVGIIAMLIGGMVIMSLMLISVSERRREIGARRALGASQRDILLQFLAEAAVIAGCGGMLGVALGVAAATLAAMRQQLAPVFIWDTIGAAVALAILTGLIFGLQPAWRAASTDPVEALRA